jgi:hypothetical protein
VATHHAAFSGQYDIAERFRAARNLASLVERQQARVEAKVRPPVSCVREGRRCEARPSTESNE